jgi:hypothetical protein
LTNRVAALAQRLRHRSVGAIIDWGLAEIAKESFMRGLLTTILASLFIFGFSVTGFAASDKCMEKCKNYAGGNAGSKKYQSCVGHYCK